MRVVVVAEQLRRPAPGGIGTYIQGLVQGLRTVSSVDVEVLASWLLETLHPWSIIGGNFVAVLVMMGILVSNHHVSLAEALSSAE